MWFDGSCLPVNPGKITIGAVIIKNENDELVFKKSIYQEHEEVSSSNYAEYVGLEIGIDWLINNKDIFNNVNVFGDSQLVIKQMNGYWRIKKGSYSDLAKKVAYKIVDNGFQDKITFNWMPRYLNAEADELTK